MMQMPRTLLHAARNPEVTGIGMKVFTLLHGTLSETEMKPVFTWSTAERLHVDQSSVNRALTHLMELGYLVRGERNGQCFNYRLALPTNEDRSPSPPGIAA